MFKELFINESLNFKPIEKYIVKKRDNKDKNKVIVSINFEDADEVEKIINSNKSLSKKLNSKDSTGKYKEYYFDY